MEEKKTTIQRKVRLDRHTGQLIEVGPAYDSGMDIAKKVIDAVNGFDSSSHDFQMGMTEAITSTHRTLQQSVMRFACNMIRALADIEDNDTDMRNENAVKLARIMKQAMDESHITLPWV